MSTIRPSLSSVIYQNLIILHTGSAVLCRPPFLFLRPRCHWSVNCRHHRPASPPLSTTRPVLLSFTMFYSFFLSTSYFIYCLLPDSYSLFSLSSTLPPVLLRSHSPYLLLRCCPRASDRFLTFQGRSSWQLRKVRSVYSKVISAEYIWTDMVS